MSRSVVIGALAERDIREARAWFDAQEPGLGDRFFDCVQEAVQRIAVSPEQYQLRLLDLRAAPVRPFKYSIWYRVLPDASVVSGDGFCETRAQYFFVQE